MKILHVKLKWVLLFVTLCLVQFSYAQLSFLVPKTGRDSTFIQQFPEHFMLRTFVNQKYKSFQIGGTKNVPGFRYVPNQNLTLGFGLTYKVFTLNVGWGLPTFSNDESIKGKTKSLDLQSSIYGRRWVYDISAQYYKGMFIRPKHFVPGYTDPYYINSNLKMYMIGGSANYIFNPLQFSYRSAMVQDEIQTKSAGSIIGSFDLYYGILKDDRTNIIPQEIVTHYSQGDLERMRFVKFGPGIGYAYSLIFKKHFYLLGSATVKLSGDITRESANGIVADNFSISPNFMLIGSVGYNRPFWSVNIAGTQNRLDIKGASGAQPYVFRSGQVKLTVALRILPNDAVKLWLTPVDNSLK